MFINTSLARACVRRKELFNDIFKTYISTTSTPNNKAFTNKKNNSLESDASKWPRLNGHINQRGLFTVQTSAGKIITKEESQEFTATFDEVVRCLTDAGKDSDIPEVYEWYAKVLRENVPTGRRARGHVVVVVYKTLENKNNLTPENIRLANILGWCAEMVQAYNILVDDIIDGSETRRGSPCWYKQVGLNAMYDSQLIENGIFTLLKTHFSHLPMYLPTVELIHDVLQKTCMGQALDIMNLKDGRPDLEAFTTKRFNSLVKYKNFYYSLHLPVTLGMYLANSFEPEQHKQANTLLMELAKLLQVQNDFLDCFGDTEKTGRIGTDIQEGKCVWPVVVALEKATPSQKKVIEENYGKHDPAAVAAIKNLYEELELRNIYENTAHN